MNRLVKPQLNWSTRTAVVVLGTVGIVTALTTPVLATQVTALPPATTAPGTLAAAPALVGSMFNVVDQINARPLWLQGTTGQGVTVAVIDTGVAPVAALSGPNKVIAKVDLSSEASVPEAAMLDTYGHGTHMSGIIAGRDPDTDPATAALHPDQFLGVAPGASIVAVKVGDNTGAVDVSQVAAGIDWVVEHKTELGIRVVNLSYGTASTQPYNVDPLAFAVERAWQAGIVVVAAVGNDGKAAHQVASPALDPFVIAVGAAERTATGWVIPTFTSSGDHDRLPDVVAPGAHIDSLRDPGSRVDVEHPEGYVSPTLFRGSGSSQATAVVSGAVALLLSKNPAWTPDQVKASLITTATGLKQTRLTGYGLINAASAAAATPPNVAQPWKASTGTGTLEASRGGQHVTVNGTVIAGEMTVLGSSWKGSSWKGSSWKGGSWTGSSWKGSSWKGSSWKGDIWTDASWAGSVWAGASWTGATWTGSSWNGSSWKGGSWTGSSWKSSSFTGSSWKDGQWAGSSWKSGVWADAGWS
jgi:serine protease AprX